MVHKNQRCGGADHIAGAGKLMAGIQLNQASVAPTS
jgi:hypothetical protein